MKKNIISILAICKKSGFAKYQYREDSLYIFSAWSVYRLNKNEITESELREKGFTGFYSTGQTADYESMTESDKRLYKNALECVHIPDKSITERRIYKVNTQYIGLDYSLIRAISKNIASMKVSRSNTAQSPVMCFDESGKFIAAVMPYRVNQAECKQRFETKITTVF